MKKSFIAARRITKPMPWRHLIFSDLQALCCVAGDFHANQYRTLAADFPLLNTDDLTDFGESPLRICLDLMVWRTGHRRNTQAKFALR